MTAYEAHVGREGPLLPILHELQETFGYIPDAAVPLIAQALNLSRAEVHGVVTFYHDFRAAPAGRHVLKLCQAEACQSCGSDALAARAEQRLGVKLGETTGDGRIAFASGDPHSNLLALFEAQRAWPVTSLRLSSTCTDGIPNTGLAAVSSIFKL